MREFLTKNSTHRFFIISVAMKGLGGILDTVAGLFLFSTGVLTRFATLLTQHELGEDPTDFLANRAREFLPYMSVSTQLFAAWYFFIHGTINLLLVYNLLRKRLWAYPAAIGVHGLFIVYQLYRFTHTHSYTLMAISILDIFVAYFIWREYEFIKIKGFHHHLTSPAKEEGV